MQKIVERLFDWLVDLIADLAVGLLASENAEIVEIVGKALVGWRHVD